MLSQLNWVKDKIMKHVGTTTQRRNVADNSITVDMVEMIIISMTSNLVSHAANSNKLRPPHNDHVHVKKNDQNSDPTNNHNGLDALKPNTASWIMILVNVECLRPDTITIRTKDSVTCLHTVDAEEMKTISIQQKNANSVVVMHKIFAVCHLFTDNARIMQRDGTTISEQMNVLNFRTAVAVVTRIISTVRATAKINAAEEAIHEMREHKHRHMPK